MGHYDSHRIFSSYSTFARSRCDFVVVVEFDSTLAGGILWGVWNLQKKNVIKGGMSRTVCLILPFKFALFMIIIRWLTNRDVVKAEKDSYKCWQEPNASSRASSKYFHSHLDFSAFDSFSCPYSWFVERGCNCNWFCFTPLVRSRRRLRFYWSRICGFAFTTWKLFCVPRCSVANDVALCSCVAA